jgi:hypothetical protein
MLHSTSTLNHPINSFSKEAIMPVIWQRIKGAVNKYGVGPIYAILGCSLAYSLAAYVYEKQFNPGVLGGTILGYICVKIIIIYSDTNKSKKK